VETIYEGCLATGKTRAEVEANICGAVAVHLRSMRRDQTLSVPDVPLPQHRESLRRLSSPLSLWERMPGVRADRLLSLAPRVALIATSPGENAADALSQQLQTMFSH
jgi:hypothetical protein